MHKATGIFFCLMLSILGISHAQPAGYRLLQKPEVFRQQLSEANRAKKTIRSNFTQVKNISLLQEKMRSGGKFYFMQEDRLRIEYTEPFSYLLVMNAGQIMVRDEQKTSRINTRSSSVMQSVNRIMIDCMRGTVLDNPDFRVTAYESRDRYLLVLEPSAETMRKMFRQIEVFLSRDDLDVVRLRMTETGGDFTEMEYSDTRHNIRLDESLFRTR